MGRIISFFGAQGRCGTSQTALCTAVKLSETIPVLLVHLEEDTGDEYTPGLCESMERLRPFLRDGLWDMDETAARAKYSRNLSVIGGAGRPASSGQFYPEDTAAFLRALSERYSFVICDCGSDICHGLSFGGLTAAEKRFTVINQNENCFRRYERQKPLLERLSVADCSFILARQNKDHPCDRGCAEKRLGLDKGSMLSVGESSFGDEAEALGKALLSFGERKYACDISRITEEITGVF